MKGWKWRQVKAPSEGNLNFWSPPPPTPGERLLSGLGSFLSPWIISQPFCTVTGSLVFFRWAWMNYSGWVPQAPTYLPYPHPAAYRGAVLAHFHISHLLLWPLNMSPVLRCFSDFLFPARLTSCPLHCTTCSDLSVLLPRPESPRILFLTSESSPFQVRFS